MKANELRIGNLVYYGAEGNICEVIGIGSEEAANGLIESKNQHGTNAERSIDFFIPIPLTEEWLVKFGGEPIYRIKDSRDIREANIKAIENNLPINYEYEDNAYVYRLKGYLIYLHYAMFNKNLGPVIQLDTSNALGVYKIPSVHKLQNILYELTGNELKFKSVSTNE